jgi:hypothetical protein
MRQGGYGPAAGLLIDDMHKTNDLYFCYRFLFFFSLPQLNQALNACFSSNGSA